MAADEIKSLYKKEAFERSGEVENVAYKLAYALNRGGETFQGQVQIKFELTHDSAESDNIFVDYKG